MSWTLGGVDLTVEKDTADMVTPRLDEINPIATTLVTYFHFSGTEAPRRDITAVFWGNFDSALSLIGSSQELVSDHGSQGNYFILSINPTRLQDLKRSAPVVRASIKLLKV
jgi:hypothetical protein